MIIQKEEAYAKKEENEGLVFCASAVDNAAAIAGPFDPVKAKAAKASQRSRLMLTMLSRLARPCQLPSHPPPTLASRTALNKQGRSRHQSKRREWLLRWRG